MGVGADHPPWSPEGGPGPEEPLLPPEEAEKKVIEEGFDQAERMLRIQERQRRARLTFWGGLVLAVMFLLPLFALYLGLCARIFSEVAK